MRPRSTQGLSGIGKLLLAAALAVFALPVFADSTVHECVMLEAVDGSFQYNSSLSECSHATAPASTFKIPHALIALQTGVVTDAFATLAWDGTDYASVLWKQDHSLNSALRWSALWFFQHTAAQIGVQRMLEGLQTLAYASDSFDADVTQFWLNGDLAVTPAEQVAFLRNLLSGNLPVKQQHVDAVKSALLMPPGRITLATGEHPFLLSVPGLQAVHAKTGNAVVAGEHVSWLVGYVVVADKPYVFASRVRAGERLASTAGAALAQAVINAQLPVLQ